MRGSWDLPGMFYEWSRKTRAKSISFSGAIFNELERVRAVITPESYFGELGKSLELNSLIPAPAKGWQKLWEGKIAAEESKGEWTAPLEKKLFAGCEKGLVSVVFTYAADADAYIDIVDAQGRSLNLGFTAVSAGVGTPLKYAFEFDKSLSESFSIKVKKTRAGDVKLNVLTVCRFGK